MEKIPFISIVIPTTGNVKFIKGLVESVNKLDYPKDKYELILIGDEKTELLERNVKKAKDFGIKTVLKYESVAAGKKRNMGVEIAKGEIIAFTDDDTILSVGVVKNNGDVSSSGDETWGRNVFSRFGPQIKTFE